MLTDLGVRFKAVVSGYEETAHCGRQSPDAYVCEHARGKAGDVARRYKRAIVIGADTVVVYRNRVLGKPSTREEAFDYLSLLNGKTHSVYTGLHLINTEADVATSGYEKTLVTFRSLTEAEIKGYLGRINPLDKAGAYAIQGAGALIVKGIKGCYYNVVGFPIAKLEDMLLQQGCSLFDFVK